jgi:uncharacterized repeat protein (TIGR01451 family)
MTRLCSFAAILVLTIAGCTSSSVETNLSATRAATPDAAHPRGRGPLNRTLPQTQPDLSKNRERETSTQILAYPTGERETSVILLEKRFPTQARLNKPYTYELKVTNTTDWPISGIVVREDFPASFTVAPADADSGATRESSAVPPPAEHLPETAKPAVPAADSGPEPAPVVPPGGTSAATSRPAVEELPSTPTTPSPAPTPHRPDGPGDIRYVQGVGYIRDIAGVWWATASRPERRGVIAREYIVGVLEAHQSKTIPVSGRSEELGKLDTRTTVTYTPVLAGGTDVINPILKLVREAPRHSDLCDPIELRYTISNIGVGTETDVVIEEALPEGLATMDGAQRKVTIPVGDLPQGQSRPFVVKVKAAHPGEFTSRAAARGAGTTAQSPEAATAVHAPKLAVTLTGPETEYVGKVATYDFVVKNVGDAVARNPAVTASADGGAAVTLPEATGGGTALAIPNIEPGQSRHVKVAARPVAGGAMNVTAIARSDCADPATASARTTVLTIPSLLMEVTDREDPVRVGEATAYRITVRNVGSGADRDVKIVATLPDKLQYVESTGPTAGKVSGKQIVFESLQQLGPGQTATWNVEVKAAEAGDVRFRVELTSESLKEPVIETQSTKLY